MTAIDILACVTAVVCIGLVGWRIFATTKQKQPVTITEPVWAESPYTTTALQPVYGRPYSPPSSPEHNSGIFGFGPVGDALVLSEVLSSNNHEPSPRHDDHPVPSTPEPAYDSPSSSDSSASYDPPPSYDSGSSSSSYDSGSSSSDSSSSSF